MKVLYKAAELVAIEPKHFTDKAGVEVEYNEAYFRIEDENGVPFVIKVNSKAVGPANERQTGTLELDIDNEGTRKPKLLSFKVE